MAPLRDNVSSRILSFANCIDAHLSRTCFQKLTSGIMKPRYLYKYQTDVRLILVLNSSLYRIDDTFNYTYTMTETLTKYSLEEVAKHDGSDGSRMWIVVKDMVIDVTDELEEHPGGDELIRECAGKDATKAFYDVGHSSNATKHLKKITVGELIEEDKAANRKKKLVPAPTTEKTPTHRSFLSIISCGSCG